jgi:hypothetical protein
MGFNVVRLWLFEVMEGIDLDEEGGVIGVQPIFVEHLREICTMARDIGMPLVISFQPHISFCFKPDRYYLYTRALFEPEQTALYMEKVLRPLAEMLREFENILLYDVYAEPEGDFMGRNGNWTKPEDPNHYGGTKEQIVHFIKEGVRVLREVSPDVPVTACSGWHVYENLRNGFYNELGLDCIGVDIYSDTGELEPVDTLGCNAPVWLSEYGSETKDNWDDDFQVAMAEGFVRNACEKGYIGAFFWIYGGPSSGESLTLIGKQGQIRKLGLEMPAIYERAKTRLPDDHQNHS